MSRKSLTTEERMQVFNKFSGHCAYCGKEIAYKDMQVDHLEPLKGRNHKTVEELETMENYMPACRMCNHYKRANTLEGWRKMIETIPEKLEKGSYIYRVGKQYGLVKENKQAVKFYFERVVK